MILSPGVIWQYLQTFLVVATGGEGGAVIGIYWVEPRDVAKYPAMHSTVPHTIDQASHVNSAKVEKPCCNPGVRIWKIWEDCFHLWFLFTPFTTPSICLGVFSQAAHWVSNGPRKSPYMGYLVGWGKWQGTLPLSILSLVPRKENGWKEGWEGIPGVLPKGQLSWKRCLTFLNPSSSVIKWERENGSCSD